MTTPQTYSASHAAGQLVGVLFDLDGTLIDTTDLIFRSYQYAMRSVLGRSVSDEALYLGYGQPLTQAFGEILTHQGLTFEGAASSELIDALIRSYRTFNLEHHDRLAREFPGVRATLGELCRRGYRLGLVTSKSQNIGRRGLALIGITDYLATLVFMEDTERHKPNPEPVLAALDRLGLADRPRQTIFIGDSTHDLRAGRAAGVQTGAALWGPFPPASLLSLEPDHVFSSIQELLPLCPPITFTTDID